MLMDTLGVMIGFVMVIAILSLVVTAVVQAIQSTFRLRSLSLRIAVTRMLKSLEAESLSVTSTDKKHVKSVLRDIGLGNCTYLSPLDVKKLFRQEHFTSYTRSRVKELFPRMEARAHDTFRGFARGITVVVSLIVAIYMQVGATDLLRQISSDVEFREKLNARADQVLAAYDTGGDRAEDGAANATLADFSTIGDSAILDLPNRFSEAEAEARRQLRLRLESVSTQGVTKADLVEEMKLALSETEGAISDEEVLAAYATLIDEKASAAAKSQMAELRKATDSLSSLGITPWRGGLEFYFDTETCNIEFRNVIGVALTASLLTFGAPFWFEQLRNLINLRDSLYAPKKAVKDEDATKKPNEGTPAEALNDRVTSVTASPGEMAERRNHVESGIQEIVAELIRDERPVAGKRLPKGLVVESVTISGTDHVDVHLNKSSIGKKQLEALRGSIHDFELLSNVVL